MDNFHLPCLFLTCRVFIQLPLQGWVSQPCTSGANCAASTKGARAGHGGCVPSSPLCSWPAWSLSPGPATSSTTGKVSAGWVSMVKLETFCVQTDNTSTAERGCLLPTRLNSSRQPPARQSWFKMGRMSCPRGGNWLISNLLGGCSKVECDFIYFGIFCILLVWLLCRWLHPSLFVFSPFARCAGGLFTGPVDRLAVLPSALPVAAGPGQPQAPASQGQLTCRTGAQAG